MEQILTRKNVIIAGIALVAVIIIALFLGRKNVVPTEETTNDFFGLFPNVPQETQQGELAPTPENITIQPIGDITQSQTLPPYTLIPLGEDPVSSIISFGTSSARYHKNIPENLGHLFERSLIGESKESRVSNITVPRILRVVWSPDSQKAIIMYDIDNVVRKILVNYSSTTPKTNFLPDSISDVAFSPDSSSFAFINELTLSHNVFISSLDFSKQQKIYDNNIPDFELSWPSKDFITLKTRATYQMPAYAYSVIIKTGEFSKVTEGNGLDVIWSYNGSSVLITKSNLAGKMQNAEYINMETGATRSLAITTIAEKCVFGKTATPIIYCGVPQFIPKAQYPDAWWQGKVPFRDFIVGIDGLTGKQIFTVPTANDVIDMHVSKNGGYIFFRDKTTFAPWALKLPN